MSIDGEKSTLDHHKHKTKLRKGSCPVKRRDKFIRILKTNENTNYNKSHENMKVLLRLQYVGLAVSSICFFSLVNTLAF